MRARVVVVALLIAAGCAAPRPVFPPDPAPGTLFRSLYLPQGTGPFPAVVLLHTCAGVLDHVVHMAHTLRTAGYAALVVDSFRPRGVQDNCNNWAVSVDEVAMDAFAALRHLRGRPGIDGDRIVVIGFSYGASAALRVASSRYQRAAGMPGFRAVVAVYPSCVHPQSDWPLADPATRERQTNLYGDVETPTLILIGDADVDPPGVARYCASRVAELRSAGRPVDIKVYPGAGHGFDQSFRYDKRTTEDAVKTSLAFYERHLGAIR